MPKTRPYQLRFSDEGQRKRIRDAAKDVKLSFPDTLRQAIDYGLPVLRKKLSKSCPANP